MFEKTKDMCCTFILGAIRSGISLTSNCIQLSHFESIQFQSNEYNQKNNIINLSLIKKIKKLRGFPISAHNEIAYSVDVETIEDKILDLLDVNQSVSSPILIFSDHLLCFTLSQWIKILREKDIKAKFVHVIRHPHEVAMFLEKEKQIPLLKGHLIWLDYIRKALQNLRGENVITLTFDQIMADPVSTLNACFLPAGIPKIRHGNYRKLLNYVQPSLKHYHASNLPIKDRQRFAEFAMLYDQLRVSSSIDTQNRISGKCNISRMQDLTVAIDNNKTFLDFAYEVIGEYEEKEINLQKNIENAKDQNNCLPLSMNVSFPLGNNKLKIESVRLLSEQWQKIRLEVANSLALCNQPIFLQFSDTNNYTFLFQSIAIRDKSGNERIWSLSKSLELNMVLGDGPCLYKLHNDNLIYIPIGKEAKIVINPLKKFNDSPLYLELWMRPLYGKYEYLKHFFAKDASCRLETLGIKNNDYSKDKEAERLVKLAHDFLKRGDASAAETIIENVLEWNSNYIPALSEYAEILYFQKAMTKTVETCKKIFSILGNNIDERIVILLIMALRALKKYDMAEENIRKGLTIYPNSTSIKKESAELSMHKQQFAEAIKKWTDLVNTHPDSSFSFGRLGYAYEYENEYLNAIRCYKKASELDRENINWQKSLDRAISSYSGTINVFPCETDVHINCPICLEQAALSVTAYPTSLIKEPIFAKFAVIFCMKCGSGYVPDAERMLKNYYESRYSMEDRKDREIAPEIYFSADAVNQYPSLRHYFQRSQSQKDILIKHGANFDKVLDYGSGPGYFLKVCDAKQPYAVDPDRYSEKYLNYINAQILEKDELPGNYFDVVVASHVVEHFDAKNAIAIVQSIIASIKKNGLLLVEVPQGGHTYLQISHPHHAPHTIFFSPEGILKLLENAGAEIIATFPRDTDIIYPSNKEEIYCPKKNDTFMSTHHECLTIIAMA